MTVFSPFHTPVLAGSAWPEMGPSLREKGQDEGRATGLRASSWAQPYIFREGQGGAAPGGLSPTPSGWRGFWVRVLTQAQGRAIQHWELSLPLRIGFSARGEAVSGSPRPGFLAGHGGRCGVPGLLWAWKGLQREESPGDLCRGRLGAKYHLGND